MHKAGLRRDPDSRHRIIAKINARLTEKATDHIQVGQWLDEAWLGEPLPTSKEWEEWGVHLPPKIAVHLRALGKDPVMRQYRNILPDKRDSLIDTWFLLQALRKIGKAERFAKLISDEMIGPHTYRDDIRRLHAWETRSPKQIARHDALQSKLESLITDITPHIGDALTIMKTLPDKSVHCIVTSPPYWLLRDYGVDGQFGQEDTLNDYIANLVAVFRDGYRVLHDNGTLWVVIGDTYTGNGTTGRRDGGNTGGRFHGPNANYGGEVKTVRRGLPAGCKRGKDLLMIPARLALALQADGWYVRADIIWDKVNPMVESAKDRPTKQYDHILMLTKKAKGYYYDYRAVIELAKAKLHLSFGSEMRLLHDVWHIQAEPDKESEHFAVFPSEVPRRCIKASCPEGGTVLDMFSGTGTTGIVAVELNRKAVLIELNPEYAAMMPAKFERHFAKRDGEGRF